MTGTLELDICASGERLTAMTDLLRATGGTTRLSAAFSVLVFVVTVYTAARALPALV